MTSAPNRMEGGFVRVPDAWIYLPISPQAKTLLVAFCAHADERGKSYCSYERLGEIVQRCKGSISTYVRELREAGLIDCKKQRYGNGYNYRLLITLIGWQDLLAHWKSLREVKKARASQAQSREEIPRSSKHAAAEHQANDRDPSASIPDHAKQPAQRPERSVQHADRKDPTGPKNQIHKTQTPEVVWTKDDEIAWRRFRPCDRDPLSAIHGQPDPALLRKVIKVAEEARAALDLFDEGEAISRCSAALQAFTARRKLDTDGDHLDKAARALASVARSQPAIDAALGSLEAAWKPYWKRLSTPEQILECCRGAAEQELPPLEERQRAGRFQNRAWLADLMIRKMPPGRSLACAA